MFREALILIFSIVVSGAVTSLIVAVPVLVIVRRQAQIHTSYFRVALFTFATDVSAHCLHILGTLLVGAVRPPITNEPLSWLVNIILLLFFGSFWARKLTSDPTKRITAPVGFKIGGTAAVFILLKNAVMLLILIRHLKAGL